MIFQYKGYLFRYCLFRRVWLCPVCNTSYASGEIEHYLIGLIHTNSMAYVLQDLQCDRCSEASNIVYEITVLSSVKSLTLQIRLAFFNPLMPGGHVATVDTCTIHCDFSVLIFVCTEMASPRSQRSRLPDLSPLYPLCWYYERYFFFFHYY